MKKRKNRSKIGMLICTLDDEYQANVWNNMADAAIEYNVNLLFFVGKPLTYPAIDLFQHHIIYNLAGTQSLDGLIILSSTIGNFITHKHLAVFCKRFQPLPTVCLGQSIKGIPSVLLDNQDSLIELIDHLVLVHGYKRIAFIKGLDNQQEAVIRYNTYRRTLKKHHIPFDPNLVAPGNFVYNTGLEAMKILLEQRKVKCDVVVCANDEMALGAYKYLQEKGIRVPQDIALTGFDDIKLAKSLNPPLTTVAQPLYEQTRKALEIVIAQIKGEKVPEKSYSPTKTIIRQSCGCPPYSMTYVDSVIKYQKFSRQKTFKDLRIDKEKIFKNTIRELKAKTNNEILYDWIQKVLQSIIKCIKSGDYKNKDFFNIITQIPATHLGVSVNETFWYNIIKILYFNILISLSDNDAIMLLELIYQKAKLALSELFQRPNPIQALNEKYMLWMLRDTNNLLTTSFELHQLLTTIAGYLPYLGIPACYISFYTDKVKSKSNYMWDIPRDSQLILASYNNQYVSIKDKKIIFPTLELVPKKYLPAHKRHTMILMPLFFREEHFGFIIFELGPRVETLYETLRGYISSSLKGALLFKKQNEVKAILRRQGEDLSQNLIKMRKAMGGFIKTMNSTVEVRDPYTANHQVRVSDLARCIAAEMKLDPYIIESLRMAAVIHDLGKIYVPAEILNKPGRLTEHEFNIIKSHPQIAFDILMHIDFPWPIAQIILQHHERLDGSGYPQRLKQKKILLEAKILAVADTVEAMSTHRPYRPALGIAKALAEIVKNKGILYDAQVVDACVQLFRKKGYKFK